MKKFTCIQAIDVITYSPFHVEAESFAEARENASKMVDENGKVFSVSRKLEVLEEVLDIENE